jgi:hypothetical protein
MLGGAIDARARVQARSASSSFQHARCSAPERRLTALLANGYMHKHPRPQNLRLEALLDERDHLLIQISLAADAHGNSLGGDGHTSQVQRTGNAHNRRTAKARLMSAVGGKCTFPVIE